MKLNLKKPIIFFDLETTGTNIMHDRIVELSYRKVYPDGKEEEKTRRLNPEMPIPPQATAVHHITDEDVKDAPTFRQIAKDLLRIFENCDIAGFNSNKFDVPLLMEEFLRCGLKFDVSNRKFVDVQTIFHKMEQRTLVAAYKFYCDKELTDAHSALADTRATYEVLKAQLDRYQESDVFGNDIEKLANFSSQNRNLDLAGRIIANENGEAIFNFGKYKGQKVEDVLKNDTGYFSWVLQGDFTQNTKDVLTRLKIEFSKK